MSLWKTGLAIAGLAFIPLAAVAYFQGSAAMLGGSAGGGQMSEGHRRDAVLGEITRQYVSQGERVTPAMRNGRELAPIAFLNAALVARGETWRVAGVDGASAETFSVS